MGLLKKKYKQIKKAYDKYKATEPERMAARIERQKKYNEFKKLQAEGRALSRKATGFDTPESNFNKVYSDYTPPPAAQWGGKKKTKR